HAAGDEHRPRRIVDDAARQHAARRPEPSGDHGADVGSRSAGSRDSRSDCVGGESRRAAVAAPGRQPPDHAHHRDHRSGRSGLHDGRCLRVPADGYGARRDHLRTVRSDRIHPELRGAACPPRHQGAARNLPSSNSLIMVLKYAALVMLLAAFVIGIRAMYEDLSEWWLKRIHTYASWLTMEFESMFEAMTID